jgi:hypothetical protein
MRTLFLILVSAVMVSAAQPAQKKTAQKPAAAAKGPLEIPAGAVESGDGFYRYTDAAGKKWVYRRTPFGVSRWEEGAGETAGAATKTAAASGITATEDGDNIRFERRTPFGTSTWQRKKGELDEAEQAAWDRQRAAAQRD